MFANARQQVDVSNRRLWIAVGVAILLIAPLLITANTVQTLRDAVLLGTLAVAFNLLYGYTGLLSFGHGMFVAVAGYTVANVVLKVIPALGISSTFGGASVLVAVAIAIIFGVVASTLLAVFVGYFSVQLEEIYFAMITLSFSMAIYVIAQYDHLAAVLPVDMITNGSDGLDFLGEVGLVNLFGIKFDLVHALKPRPFYYVSLIVSLLAVYAMWRIVNSPFGTICQALRENSERAEALGVNVRLHRWKTFIISGAFTGLAGAMMVVASHGILPKEAHWSHSAEPVIVSVIGGPYSFLGPVVGAFTFEFLREFIRNFALLEQYWELSFGILLLVVVLFFDNGVTGGIKRFGSWLSNGRDHYRQDGVGGFVGFVGETIVATLVPIRHAVVGVVDSITGRLGPGSSD